MWLLCKILAADAVLTALLIAVAVPLSKGTIRKV